MININLPKDYTLYETSYGSDIPAQQIYILIFNTLPSRYSNKIEYNIKIIDFLITEGYVEIIRNESTKKYTWSLVKNFVIGALNDTEDRLYVNIDKKIIIKAQVKKINNFINTVFLDFNYDISKGSLTNQFDFEKLISIENEKKKASINLVKSDMGHLDTEEYELNVPEMNLKLNYGSDFIKIHELIVKRLNKQNDKGIILLHGAPGSGKTSYIKYLTKLIPEKEILFIPPSMAEMLSEPSIIPFLMEHKNSVLIIEDAEKVISDRETGGSSSGVSNILNLTDGILGDCLNIQIIATFNMNREKIDQALLRKGRLIVEHKFGELNVDETNILLKHLKKDVVSDKPLTLADIYNIDVEQYRTTNKTKKIGF